MVFFGRVELREARAKNVGLPVFSAAAYGLLLGTKVDEPDFGAIHFGGVADENDFEDRLVGLEIEFVMKLGYERAEFFQEADADEFEVGIAGAGGLIGLRIGGTEVPDFAIEADRPGLRGNLPLGSAEEHADMCGPNGGNTRWDGLGLDGVVDDAKNDGVAGDVNQDAAAGEVGDDFVFLGVSGCGKAEHC